MRLPRFLRRRRRGQCPGYRLDRHRRGQWRCVRRCHKDRWHMDCNGVEWPAPP